MYKTDQIQSVKDLEFSNGGMSRVGQIAVVRIGGKRAEAVLVGGSLTNGVKDFHVTDVVDEQRFLKAHNQTLERKKNALIILSTGFVRGTGESRRSHF